MPTSPSPERLPFLWKLFFLIFIIFGFLTLLSSLEIFKYPQPGEEFIQQSQNSFERVIRALPLKSKLEQQIEKILNEFFFFEEFYTKHIWSWRWFDLTSNIFLGILMILAGFGGFRRKLWSCYLSIFILVSSIPWGAVMFWRAYELGTDFCEIIPSINRMANTITISKYELLQTLSRLKTILGLGLALIGLLHLWLGLILWKRRHWFGH